MPGELLPPTYTLLLPPPPPPTSTPAATPLTRHAQKCLKLGHHTYECKNPRPYVPRPSRTKQLASGAKARDTPSVVTPDEFKTGYGVGLADKILKAKEAERQAATRGRGGGYGGRDRSASPRRR